jgi:uncharacterized OsmC-like protein
MIERRHDRDLAELLRAYDARIGGGATREHVSVALLRTAGFHNCATTATGHQVIIDEPVTFGGQGAAADPAELLLAAAGASLSVTITAHAALRGIHIDRLAIDLTGWMAADSFFRPDGAAATGMQALVARVHIRSAAPRPDLEDLLAHAVHASPVVQSLARPPRIELVLEDA